jgi:hypothetical protein
MRYSFLIASLVLSHLVLSTAETSARAESVPVDADKAALATYRANAYSIIHLGSGPVNGSGTSWRPVRGLYRISVEYEEFFTSAGRPDLAERFASRHAWSRGLSIGGDVAAYVGGAVGLLFLFQGRTTPCLIAFGAGAAGVAVHEVGAHMDKSDYPEDAASALADEYNQALRARLGLEAPGPEQPTRKAPRPTVMVVPSLSVAGVGIAANVTY